MQLLYLLDRLLDWDRTLFLHSRQRHSQLAPQSRTLPQLRSATISFSAGSYSGDAGHPGRGDFWILKIAQFPLCPFRDSEVIFHSWCGAVGGWACIGLSSRRLSATFSITYRARGGG
jgi:hypothetical protein